MAAIVTGAADGDAMKNRRRTPTKTKRRDGPKVSGRRNPSGASADTKVALLTRERDEALEQLSAASQVLKVISSSPGDLKPVFQAMLENAARVCDAWSGNIFRWEGDAFHHVATHNTPPAFAEARRNSAIRPHPKDPLGRIHSTRKLVHISDAAAEEVYNQAAEGDGSLARHLKAVAELRLAANWQLAWSLAACFCAKSQRSAASCSFHGLCVFTLKTCPLVRFSNERW